MSESGHPITRQWYDRSFLWDKMSPEYPWVSMKEALDFLRERSGKLRFMTETGNKLFRNEEKSVDSVAEADARALADRIERDWFESYRLAEQFMFIPNQIADDVYVFDPSLKWCAVFTHETSDREAERNEDARKTAESRLCILCKG